jgi:hypothetical protein
MAALIFLLVNLGASFFLADQVSSLAKDDGMASRRALMRDNPLAAVVLKCGKT